MPVRDLGSPVSKTKLLSSVRARLPCGRNKRDRFYDVPDLSIGGTGIHADRAAHRTRDAGGELKARKTMVHGVGEEPRKTRSRPGMDNGKGPAD